MEIMKTNREREANDKIIILLQEMSKMEHF